MIDYTFDVDNDGDFDYWAGPAGYPQWNPWPSEEHGNILFSCKNTTSLLYYSMLVVVGLGTLCSIMQQLALLNLEYCCQCQLQCFVDVKNIL